MTDMEKLIKQDIEQNGPMNFYRFTELCLYHPQYGYYNRKKPQRGREGDYFTSFQVGGLFPAVFVEALLDMKKTLGTDHFHLVELGAGFGEFLETVLSELEKRGELKGIHAWAIDASSTARDHLLKRLSRFPRVRVLPSIDEAESIGGVDGCLFSNEFADALPFHRLKWTGNNWEEIAVAWQDGAFREVQTPLADEGLLSSLNFSEVEFEPGQEIEARPQVPGVMTEWNGLIKRGYIALFDYGFPRHEMYHPRRRTGTWKGFYRHKMVEDPFQHMGDMDLTAHVDFSQWAHQGKEQGFDPALFCSQASFLTRLGGEKLDAFLREAPPEERAKRAGAIQQLIHPAGMGESFWGLFLTKDAPLPPKLADVSNRIKRLLI